MEDWDKDLGKTVLLKFELGHAWVSNGQVIGYDIVIGDEITFVPIEYFVQKSDLYPEPWSPKWVEQNADKIREYYEKKD